MQFGVFYQIPCSEGQTPADRYADVMAQVQLADQLGYDMAWLAELHFARSFSVMPGPAADGIGVVANHPADHAWNRGQPAALASPSADR